MKRFFLSFIVLGITSSLHAEVADLRLHMVVRPEVEVNAATVRLGDIGRFSGNVEEYGTLLEKLQSVKVADVTTPKSKVVVEGESILRAISSQGISPDAIGYSIPQSVTIERAGRHIKQDEIVAAVQNRMYDLQQMDRKVRSVSWDGDQVIPTGAARTEVEILGEPTAGTMPVRCTIFVDGSVESRFLATATIDDWKAIPMLKVQVNQGEVIREDDIQFVRANLAEFPSDVALLAEDVFGKRVKRSVAAGAPVRRSELDLPPLVPAGKHIKVQYASGGFSATVTGIALEDGRAGDEIRVRNASSNKIIRARVNSAEDIVVAFN